MTVEKIALGETNSFSPIFLDYISGKESLKPFYNLYPSIANFSKQIEDKPFSQESRQVLYKVLKQQYSSTAAPKPVQDNLTLLLDENTYTITTGHQLNLFTGPLYFIYKIVTAVNTCKALKRTYPNYNFVPVYWMASEDHDFEEISFFHLFGKKYQWETNQKGAVGRFETSELKQLLEGIPGDTSIFEKAYLQNDNLADAVRDYVNTLFGEEGLIVIDADDRSLKSQIKDFIFDDIIKHSAQPLVADTSSQLKDLGYKDQIFPRDINFFYLEKGLRGRLEKDGIRYNVVDTNLSFSKEEISKLIEEEPEKFSPNVVMRPLYQERILPNLAYIGGGAEMAYWMQLREVFNHYQTTFPILIPRNFAMVMGKSPAKKFVKAGLTIEQLFLDKETLLKNYVGENTEHDIELNEEKTQILNIFKQLALRGEAIDPSLKKFIEAQGAKAANSVDDIEKRFLKAEKRNHETKFKQVESVKDNLFPNGKLQERHDNFLNFYENNPDFIKALLSEFDPFGFSFYVFKEDF